LKELNYSGLYDWLKKKYGVGDNSASAFGGTNSVFPFLLYQLHPPVSEAPQALADSSETLMFVYKITRRDDHRFDFQSLIFSAYSQAKSCVCVLDGYMITIIY
jgi:hypothetical protein